AGDVIATAERAEHARRLIAPEALGAEPATADAVHAVPRGRVALRRRNVVAVGIVLGHDEVALVRAGLPVLDDDARARRRLLAAHLHAILGEVAGVALRELHRAGGGQLGRDHTRAADRDRQVVQRRGRDRTLVDALQIRDEADGDDDRQRGRRVGTELE